MTDELEAFSNTEHAKQWLREIRESNLEYDPLVTYYFVNKNLDMSKGKLAAQAARAGQVMLLGESTKRETSLLFKSLDELFEFDFMKGNKTIFLKANENQLRRILYGDLFYNLKEVETKMGFNLNPYPVFDIGANEVETNSLTVVGLTPFYKSKINHIVKKFQVL